MKSLIVLSFALLLSLSATAQSKSFRTLKNKFDDSEEVHSFSVSGFFARTILWMAGEHEFTSAVRNVNSIKLITIPASEFRSKKVTVNGFKQVVKNDNFEELASIRDHGDDVTVFIQPAKHEDDNRYMVVVESGSEVVVLEIRGYIDPNLLLPDTNLSYND